MKINVMPSPCVTVGRRGGGGGMKRVGSRRYEWTSPRFSDIKSDERIPI